MTLKSKYLKCWKKVKWYLNKKSLYLNAKFYLHIFLNISYNIDLILTDHLWLSSRYNFFVFVAFFIEWKRMTFFKVGFSGASKLPCNFEMKIFQKIFISYAKVILPFAHFSQGNSINSKRHWISWLWFSSRPQGIILKGRRTRRTKNRAKFLLFL